VQAPVPICTHAFDTHVNQLTRRCSARAVLQMQSVMQPVEDETRLQSNLSAAQEREQFAAAMRSTMETQAALDQEEDRLVEEARRVGMSWPDIAVMLPTRQLSELKRRHSSHAAAQVCIRGRSYHRPLHRSYCAFRASLKLWHAALQFSKPTDGCVCRPASITGWRWHSCRRCSRCLHQAGH
jgi:hypothetical protein